ncbi:MAG: LLM class flavin-dependent oxidoreductase [Myxococcota bacterium]|nr:LLM class flavin-dependent oxidoreductase [Myxococcota bacterium]
MQYDIFFSISQTPVNGEMPNEAGMFASFFDQVELADKLGFEVAWVAESHLSSEVQKTNKAPVIPHWKGEVGLNVDLTQVAHQIFARTKNIEVGSAVMNILCNGGPIAAAERIAYAAFLHGLNPAEKRRLHVGFAAGRFDFMNRASGIVHRDAVEEAAGPAMKGKTFGEATEIFLRLLRGDTLSSDDIEAPTLQRSDFRSDEHWESVQKAFGDESAEVIPLRRRWEFEALKIVPQEWRRELVQLIIGSHDPKQQDFANTILPTQVFNLSITRPEIIEATHERMNGTYHTDGGGWQRGYMPRTAFVFVHHDTDKSDAENQATAEASAKSALGAYWTALEGTLDPNKVAKASDNALVGNPETVAAQIVERFHPEDRLMLWFDFFNHDNDAVKRSMKVFMDEVAPRVEKLLKDKAS